MTKELGLRERKKIKTRRTISAAAMRLFVERGFENVSIAEVAEAAEVSKMTVFNYFGTKEDLVFDRQDEVVHGPSRTVRTRPPGMSAVTALRDAYLDDLRSRDPLVAFSEGIETFARLLDSSPALQARTREIFERREAELAATFAEEDRVGDGGLTARLVAGQVTAVHRVLFHESCRRLLDGQDPDEIAGRLAQAAQNAFDLLEAGIGKDYCVRREGE
ncbi:TetR/AcrR family transcriptional regulator [Actinomadura formosensis]|uniref:TetR/AcrR family transcriptional regulator n=1 Tax=Actinomadura formosensis TaxID=60706 RepID=UPI00082EE4F2|nr:TetR/AcrR family transcriptional regulator [Actinomadura formosensis]